MEPPADPAHRYLAQQSFRGTDLHQSEVVGNTAILMDDADQFHILRADQHIESPQSELFSCISAIDDGVSVNAFLAHCFQKDVDSFGS